MEVVNWEKLKRGLEKYLVIMEDFKNSDVSVDVDFQRKYKGFYRVRRGKEFCLKYFLLLQENRENSEISFKTVLHELLPLGRLEAFFSSKLLATINPDLPVWDSVVLKKIMSECCDSNQEDNRIGIATHRYNCILKWYENKINSDSGREMISTFEAECSGLGLTATKKIDLMLWQMR